MITYPPSIFNAYNICPRQAWLMYHQLNADQSHDFLEIGRLIEKMSFAREKKKVYLADIEAMIDMVTKKEGVYYIAEVKKSSRTLDSGIFQLKYYLFLLKYRKGIITKGLIKIPKEKISKEVVLNHDDENRIKEILQEMSVVLNEELPPKPDKMLSICKKCAHFEFCWS